MVPAERADRTSLLLGCFTSQKIELGFPASLEQLEGSLRTCVPLLSPTGEAWQVTLFYSRIFQRTVVVLHQAPSRRSYFSAAGSRTRSCADLLRGDRPPFSAPRPACPIVIALVFSCWYTRPAPGCAAAPVGRFDEYACRCCALFRIGVRFCLPPSCLRIHTARNNSRPASRC